MLSLLTLELKLELMEDEFGIDCWLRLFSEKIDRLLHSQCLCFLSESQL